MRTLKAKLACHLTRCLLPVEIVERCGLATGPVTAGLPRVREKSGKLKFFQGQGIVREFCKLSGKFGNTVKCQGIVREF